uniref:Uncharacterized protein n=1 Tax=Eutreptiella gymnastica TaxID=73025 RepID=A0A7S1NKF1_9EUGL
MDFKSLDACQNSTNLSSSHHIKIRHRHRLRFGCNHNTFTKVNGTLFRSMTYTCMPTAPCHSNCKHRLPPLFAMYTEKLLKIELRVVILKCPNCSFKGIFHSTLQTNLPN